MKALTEIFVLGFQHELEKVCQLLCDCQEYAKATACPSQTICRDR